MIMLPCPETGTLTALLKHAVLFNCIYQGYISVIHFGLLVKELEYTVCTRKGHNDGVELLAHLVDRPVETLVKGKETCQITDAERKC